MNRPGVLENEMTNFISDKFIGEIGELMKVGDKGVFTLYMLYNWWIVYLIQNNMIKDNQWVHPNVLLDTLLADQYIEFGVTKGQSYRLHTFLSMIGKKLDVKNIKLNQRQMEYLQKQNKKLESLRFEYRII